MKQYVSIDIGGTAIKYGIIDEDAHILCKASMDTEAHKGGPAILEKVLAIVDTYRQEKTLSGVCISTAGMVDVEKGAIFYAAPLIPHYAGTNFKAAIEDRFGLPCEVENDVNCAGLAEYLSGASQGSSSAVMLTVGTGIGGCAIIDGKVYHGFSGSGMEIGYMHTDGSDFQTLGAASVLTRKVAQWKNEPETAWNGLAIFDAAKNGDAVCILAIDEMVDVLGKGIANICYVLNPQVVVLGGGIMAQEAYLRKPLERALKKWLVPSIAEKTTLAFATHRNDAGMLGAFYHFQQRHPHDNE